MAPAPPVPPVICCVGPLPGVIAGTTPEGLHEVLEPRIVLSSDLAPGRCPRSIDAVTLVLDGPEPAYEPALRYLARGCEGLVVVPYLEDHAPPAFEVLELIVKCRLMPGIDPNAIEWVTDEHLWWTTATGPLRLDGNLSDSTGRASLARILARSRDLDQAGTPPEVRRGLERGADGSSVSLVQLLASHYFAAAIARLGSGTIPAASLRTSR